MTRGLLTVAVALLAVLLGATPAWAHGGPIQLDVRSDGGQGITATVTYVRDGHAVPGEVRMTYTAVSADGAVTGPVPMVASAEGQAFYLAKEPLPLGDWTVTVTATHPSAATRTVSVSSVELPPVATAPAPSSTFNVTMVTIPAAVAVLAIVLTFLLRRRRPARAA